MAYVVTKLQDVKKDVKETEKQAQIIRDVKDEKQTQTSEKETKHGK